MISGGADRKKDSPHVLFHQLTKDALQAPLLSPFQPLLRRPSPLLCEYRLHVVRADIRKGTWGIELSAVTEDEHHIFLEILHRLILILVEALIDCTKIHRVLDFVIIPGGDQKLVLASEATNNNQRTWGSHPP